MSDSLARPLRFGILGCARIVRRAIAGSLVRARRAVPWAIASRNGDMAQAWATEMSIPKAYGSYEALIADPDVDAVYIPLPNEMHLEWSVRAAEAGKHVLCEKPLACDLAEAQAIADGVHRHGRLLMEAFMWRHHPRVTAVREMIASGRLGELRMVKMDFSFDIDRSDWRLDRNRGGGALYDLGCYGINASRLFTGAEPTEILATCHKHSTGVDMSLGMVLKFPGDVLAVLDCSFESTRRNRFEIVGSQAAVELPGGVLPATEAELVVHTNESVETIRFAEADQYAEQIDIFCASIDAGKLIAPAEDGVANMRVLDAVRRQAWGE